MLLRQWPLQRRRNDMTRMRLGVHCRRLTHCRSSTVEDLQMHLGPIGKSRITGDPLWIILFGNPAFSGNPTLPRTPANCLFGNPSAINGGACIFVNNISSIPMAACISEHILVRPVRFTAVRGACKAYPIRLMPIVSMSTSQMF